MLIASRLEKSGDFAFIIVDEKMDLAVLGCCCNFLLSYRASSDSVVYSCQKTFFLVFTFWHRLSASHLSSTISTTSGGSYLNYKPAHNDIWL